MAPVMVAILGLPSPLGQRIFFWEEGLSPADFEDGVTGRVPHFAGG